MTLIARLAALERRRAPTPPGLRVTLLDPDGAVIRDTVIGDGRPQEPGAFPGVIAGQLILTDDGTPATRRSLLAQWFDEGDEGDEG